MNLVDILVVEDNPDHVELLVETLNEYRVVNHIEIFETGEEALARLKAPGKNRPGLIILDINLPGLGGLEVLEQLKKDPTTSDISVWILTTSNTDSERSRADTLSADRYMVKPLDIEQLWSAVNATRLGWGLLE